MTHYTSFQENRFVPISSLVRPVLACYDRPARKLKTSRLGIDKEGPEK